MGILKERQGSELSPRRDMVQIEITQGPGFQLKGREVAGSGVDQETEIQSPGLDVMGAGHEAHS